MLCFVSGGGGPPGSSAYDIDNKRCNFPDLVKLPSPEPDIKFGRLLEDTDPHNIGKNHTLLEISLSFYHQPRAQLRFD